MPAWIPTPPRTCEGCGSTFYRARNVAHVTFIRRRFCSRECDLAHRTHRQDDEGGRSEARRLYPDQPCERCGGKGERHHIDSNRLNNRRSNIAFLCKKHHKDAHRLSDGKIGGGARPRVNAMIVARAKARTAEARHLRRQGLLIREIAEQMGVHPVSVERWFRKYPETDAA